MSTSQRAVMLCGWGLKAGIACLQVCVFPHLSALESTFWYLKALYKCPGYFTFSFSVYTDVKKTFK